MQLLLLAVPTTHGTSLTVESMWTRTMEPLTAIWQMQVLDDVLGGSLASTAFFYGMQAQYEALFMV